jgi:hypothetical protein
MNDIELSQKIKNLKWKIDLKAGTCKSELVRYKIIYNREFIDLKSVWINPDIPPVAGVINTIQRSAVTAYQEAIKDA